MARDRSPDDPPRGYTTEDVAATPAPPTRPARRWKLKAIVALVIVLPIAVVAIWTWIALSYSYSDGFRAGYVQKFSQKGWLCKSWEGELAQVIPGQAQIVVPQNAVGALNTFSFTVRDDAVAKQIEETEGKHVRLSYSQHKGIPFSCFGETEYYVTGVSPVQP